MVGHQPLRPVRDVGFVGLGTMGEPMADWTDAQFMQLLREAGREVQQWPEKT